jgi:hypothetical protein
LGNYKTILKLLIFKKSIISIIFFVGLIYTFKISLDRQENNNSIEWKRNIFGDGAGYYSYLPFTFLYNYNTNNLPENIDQKTGYGFYIENNKIKTKYTSGVAILLSPFFFAVHLYEKIKKADADGFFGTYHYVPFIAAWFYALLGLLLLFSFLRNFISLNSSLISLAIIFWGTNLYYYVIEYASMSHVYSFFLFSCFIYFSFKFHQIHKLRYFIILVLSGALIILIRPTNIILIPFFFIIEYLVNKQIQLKTYLTIKHISIALIGFTLIFTPQIIYWMYLSGKPFYYSYEKESFSNWASPKIIEFLFSPNNGLITYNPIWIVIFIAAIYLAIKKEIWSIATLISTTIIIYLGASWHDWTFGCSYGSRTLIEFTSLFALPLGVFIQNKILDKKIIVKTSFFSLIIILVFINLQLTQKYERCFFGSNNWDWKYYSYLLRPWGYEKQESFNYPNFIKDEFIGNLNFYKNETDNFSYHLKITAKANFEIPSDNTDIYLVLATEGSNDDVNYQWPLNHCNNVSIETAILPPKGGNWKNCKLYVWNKSKSEIKINYLKLRVE